MIARLAAELHCYVPEELDETWAHLRHLGRRRAQLITQQTASMHRVRDFLSVAWPTVIETCAQPLLSKTWLAALEVVTARCGGQPAGLAVMGEEAFTALVRGAVAGWGGQRAWGTICWPHLRRADRHRGRGRLLPPRPAAPVRRGTG